MKRHTFAASQFTPTRFDTAEDKAKFANHFVRFVESGFKWTLFPKWFYTRLSMTFGHIAHFDQRGFYATFFSDLDGQLAFLKQTLRRGGFGSPAHTYSDVERALARWVDERDFVGQYELRKAVLTEQTEREQLARLKAKYPDAGV